MKAWSKDKMVEIRSPNATRPWQHVLEPLSGYLCLDSELFLNKNLNGEANFGPDKENCPTVEELIIDLGKYWGLDSNKKGYQITDNVIYHEAKLLTLNCKKAFTL